MNLTNEHSAWMSLLALRREKVADALEDPAVRGYTASVVDKYSDQAHFIYELIQNADDAGATWAEFRLSADNLVFVHNGTRKFSVSNPDSEAEDYACHRLGDVNAITGIGFSSKKETTQNGNSIGKFGMGFKSIFQYTDRPEIYDDGISFCIERQIVPRELPSDYAGRKRGETLFVFPFQHGRAERCYADTLVKLRSLSLPTLFLRNLAALEYSCTEESGEYAKRVVQDGNYKVNGNDVHCQFIECAKKHADRTSVDRLWLFSRTDGENNRYAVGFLANKDGLVKPARFKAFCFFPTRHETRLKFIVHAPFLLTDSRESIKAQEPHNLDMVDKLSRLSADAIVALRDLGERVGMRFYDEAILNVIPLCAGEWEDTLSFEPFYLRIHDLFRYARVLPANDGYVYPEHAYLPSSHRQTEVFPDELLKILTVDPQARWVFPSVSSVGKFGEEALGYVRGLLPMPGPFTTRHVGPVPAEQRSGHIASDVSLLDTISAAFVEQRDKSWRSIFYRWLDENEIRRTRAQRLPIFLNQDMKASAPFDAEGNVRMFLPVKGGNRYETINPVLLKDKYCKALVERYGIREPDKFDHVNWIIDSVLPQASPGEIKTLLPTVFSHYFSLSNEEQRAFAIRCGSAVKLECVSCMSGRTAWAMPCDLYFKTPDLAVFFSGHASTFLLDEQMLASMVEPKNLEALHTLLVRMGVKEWPAVDLVQLSYDDVEDRMPMGGRGNIGRGTKWFEGRVDGLDDFLERMTAEKSKSEKRKMARVAWRVISGINSAIMRSEMNVRHSLQVNALNRVNDISDAVCGWCLRSVSSAPVRFASSQQARLATIQWLETRDGNLIAPIDLGFTELARHYEDCHGAATVLAWLQSSAASDRDAISARDRAERDGLSDSNKQRLDLGILAASVGMTVDDIAEWKARKDAANRKMLGERTGIEKAGGAKNLGDGVVGRLHGRVAKIKADRLIRGEAAVTDACSPLEIKDEDALIPVSVDVNAQIRRYEEEQAQVIARLEEREALQRQALSFPMYTVGWLKNLLRLEVLAAEESTNNAKEISISFSSVARLPNEGFYDFSQPSRSMPGWLEDVSDIPMEITLGRKIVHLVIESMSIRSYSLRVRFRASSKLEGVDFEKMVSANIRVQRPMFLLQSLQKEFDALGYDERLSIPHQLPNDIEFVFGPPGTGKTTFLAAERLIPKMKPGAGPARVLVLAPTNKAADVLASRIVSLVKHDARYRQWLVRFGTCSDEGLEASGICPGKNVDLGAMRKCVVVTTVARFPYDTFIPGNSAPKRLMDQQWDWVVIDEASMIPLASIVLPLLRCTRSKFIIAGDPNQIDPVVLSEPWKGKNIYTMVRLTNFTNPKTYPVKFPVVRLFTQYRSLPCIGSIYGCIFYGGELNHHRTAIGSNLELRAGVAIAPLTLVRFPVSVYESIYRLKRLGTTGGSAYHIYSALLTFELLKAVAESRSGRDGVFRIGVISPYRAQAEIVQKLISASKFPKNVLAMSSTVHGFQGDECEMVIALFNPPPGIPGGAGCFVNRRNIVNVSISRARDYLVLVVPDKKTPDVERMELVSQVVSYMDIEPGVFKEYASADLEKKLFGKRNYIEESVFATGHQSVNVYGKQEQLYEVRTEGTALDIQINSQLD